MLPVQHALFFCAGFDRQQKCFNIKYKVHARMMYLVCTESLRQDIANYSRSGYLTVTPGRYVWGKRGTCYFSTSTFLPSLWSTCDVLMCVHLIQLDTSYDCSNQQKQGPCLQDSACALSACFLFIPVLFFPFFSCSFLL